MKRYRVLVLDDESWKVPVIALKNAGLTRSIVPSELRSESWAYFDTWQPEDLDLLSVYATGDPVLAVKRFQQSMADGCGPFDVVLIDMDLHGAPGNHGPFSGIGVYRNLAESLVRCGQLEQSLLMIYTRSDDVLKSLPALVVDNASDYRMLERIAKPLIVKFGEKGWGSDSQDTTATHCGAELWHEIVEQRLTALSLTHLRRSGRLAGVVDSIRGTIENRPSLSANEFIAFSRQEIDGWRLCDLFPFHFARIHNTVDFNEARPILKDLLKTTAFSFRNSFGEFCDLFQNTTSDMIAGLRHVEKTATLRHPKENFWDVEDQKIVLRGLQEKLQGASRLTAFAELGVHDGDDPKTWLDELRGILREAPFNHSEGWVQFCNFVTAKVKPEALEVTWESHDDPVMVWSVRNQVGWFMLADDLKRIEAVLKANAARHEKLTTLPPPEFCQEDDSFSLLYRCSPTTASEHTSLDATRLAIGLGLPHDRHSRSQKLSELRHVVCHLYDGLIEFEAGPPGSRWVMRVDRDKVGNVTKKESTLRGTTVRLIFPRGRW